MGNLCCCNERTASSPPPDVENGLSVGNSDCVADTDAVFIPKCVGPDQTLGGLLKLEPETGEMIVPYKLLRLARAGCTVSYAEVGDLASKEVVFYHHGWPGSRVGALLAHKAAVELKMRVVCVERPGYGRSPYAEYTIKQWPSMLQEVAESLGCQRFSLLGVSGGGAFAAAAARFLPAEQVVSLGLMCPLGFTDSSWKLRTLFWMVMNYPEVTHACWKTFQGAMEKDPLFLAKRFTATVDREILSDDPVSAAILKLSNKEGLRQGAEGWCQDAKLYKSDWGFNLQDIPTKRAYLWHGLLDYNVPIASVELYKQIPNLVTRFFEGEGHLSMCVRQIRQALLQLKAAHDEQAGKEPQSEREDDTIVQDVKGDKAITVEPVYEGPMLRTA